MELLIYNEKKEGCPKHFVEDCRRDLTIRHSDRFKVVYHNIK